MRQFVFLLALVGSAWSLNSAAATPPPEVQKRVRAATFEVVVPKPSDASVTYARPLPLELLPFNERNDTYCVASPWVKRRAVLAGPLRE
jgi:hypothetical protein